MRRFQIDCGGQTTGDKDAIVLDVQGEARNVNLRVDYITRGMLGNIPELLGDLLEISAYVFCADQRASRGSDQLTDYGRDWRRDMRFNIPVRCPDVWSDASVQEELCKTLGFLSDDAYTFEFTLSENPAEIQEQYFPNLIDAAPSVDEVALFSGGIDSFAGAVNAIVKNRKSLLLVGHFGSPKIRNVQDALVKGLEERGYNQQASFVPILVSNVKARTVEDTQRTRSFLFACLGLVIAQMAGKDRFTFYENGIVSLNPPVSGDILGGRATRTTHPRVLRGLERLFSLILEREISIDTPLQWMTKPEVVLLIKDAGMSDLLPTTCSCTRTHSRTKAQPHCGECSQCIDRRFAVLAAGMEEYEPASTYCLDLLTSDRTGDEKLRMALNYVAFFNKLRGVPQNRFIAAVLSGLDCPLAIRPVTLSPGLLWKIGDCRLPGRAKKVPVWIARGLSNSKIWQEFKAKTQTRPSPGLRAVLSLGPETALPAAPVPGHEIVAIESVANTGTEFLVDANMLAARVSLGTGNDEAPVVMAADGGVIIVRGKRYSFSGTKQKAVIRHLFEAWDSGQPECLTAAVLEDAEYKDSVSTLGKAFSGHNDWHEFIEEKNGTCWIYV